MKAFKTFSVLIDGTCFERGSVLNDAGFLFHL